MKQHTLSLVTISDGDHPMYAVLTAGPSDDYQVANEWTRLPDPWWERKAIIVDDAHLAALTEAGAAAVVTVDSARRAVRAVALVPNTVEAVSAAEGAMLGSSGVVSVGITPRVHDLAASTGEVYESPDFRAQVPVETATVTVPLTLRVVAKEGQDLDAAKREAAVLAAGYLTSPEADFLMAYGMVPVAESREAGTPFEVVSADGTWDGPFVLGASVQVEGR